MRLIQSIGKNLIEQYNDKFEHGSVLVDDDFNDKSVEFLKEKREAFVNSLNQFNTDIKDFVKKTLELAIKKKKIKKTAILLSCPFLIIGCFGFHKFYLRQAGYGILYILLSLVGISGLLALINFFQLILMSQDKFDVKYNPEFSYYSQFKFD